MKGEAVSQSKTVLKGVVHGKTIELEDESGLPDGQQVSVIVQPTTPVVTLAPGEGIRQSAGAWADAGEELDAWLEELQRSRQQDRSELP
jgi:hypothetical protein